MKKYALISVSDKTNIKFLAKELINLGYSIISTGGTYKYLSSLGFSIINVEKFTDFPEILEGRVKTLHPKIFGAILADPENTKHNKDLSDHKIFNISIVVVNLYPFQTIVNNKQHSLAEAIENIDIGGVSLLRSGAKNYKNVTTIFEVQDYEKIITELKENNKIAEDTKLFLAKKVFLQIARYDNKIARYLMEQIDNNPIHLEDSAKKVILRYGENPQQTSWCIKYGKNNAEYSILHADQINGKDMSYNNINDSNTALNLLSEFRNTKCFISLKHMNSCGVGCDTEDSYIAWKKCYEGDKISIFGGIIATNCEITEKIALEIKSIFLEIIIAPSFTKKALEILKSKLNLRIFIIDLSIVNVLKEPEVNVSSINGGMLFQTQDDTISSLKDWKLVSKNNKYKDYIQDMEMAWKIVKHLKSNAICIVKNQQLIGIGVGQTNRILAVELALKQASTTKNAVLASDAFFPMTDSIKLIGKHSIKIIIQPSGSIKDKDIIEEANKQDLILFHTPERHFYH